MNLHINNNIAEAVAQTCSVKKVFLEISQNWQENTFFTERLWWLLLNICQVLTFPEEIKELLKRFLTINVHII